MAMNRVGRAIRSHGVAALLVGAILLGTGSVAVAQTTPTDPSKAWIYCWGYHVSDGRRYHCVSSTERQPIMESFLPAEGTQCDGSIRGYSRGRTGIQMDCTDDPAWTRSGTGDAFFTKPAAPVRVRITSSYSGESASFKVRCYNADGVWSRLVNELVGSLWDNTGSTGLYRMQVVDDPCVEVEVYVDPEDVSWTFRQLDTALAYSPPRYWSHVTGVGLDLDAEALQHLAIAVEEERAGAAVPPPVR